MLTMDSLDERITQLKEELETLREERSCAKRDFEATKRERCNAVQALQHRIGRVVKRGNELRYYVKAMEGAYGDSHHHLPYVLKLEGRLLQASHHLEVLNKHTDLVQSQEDQMATYMRCEISVMEDEQIEVEAAFLNQKATLQFQQQKMQEHFCRREIPQHMVLQRLRAIRRARPVSMPSLVPTDQNNGNNNNNKLALDSDRQPKPDTVMEGDEIEEEEGGDEDEQRQDLEEKQHPQRQPQSPMRGKRPSFLQAALGKSVAKLMQGLNKRDQEENECITVASLAA